MAGVGSRIRDILPTYGLGSAPAYIPTVHHFLFSLMLSPAGACLIAALDSTIFVFTPVAVDLSVIFITSRHPNLFWLFPIRVSASSLLGAFVTFYLGGRLGEPGLEHFISARRLKRIKGRLQGSGTVAIAALDLLPPPFPFTAFILSAGALKLNTLRFLVAVFAFRIVRFGAEAVLAAIYGRHIVSWMESDAFRYVADSFTAIVLVGTVFVIVQLVRSTRKSRQATRSSRAQDAG
jgi:membrane protein YqaA with SNARE-associated domain